MPSRYWFDCGHYTEYGYFQPLAHLFYGSGKILVFSIDLNRRKLG